MAQSTVVGRRRVFSCGVLPGASKRAAATPTRGHPMTPTVPNVAIVIPTRDRPHLLADAIKSALLAALSTDRHDGCDVIVVDNSSTRGMTDESRRVAAEHGVRFLESFPAGVSRARNVGMAATDAQLISFLDDDDAYTDCFLDVLLELHERHTSAAVTFGRPVMCDAQLVPVFEVPEKPDLPSGDAFVFSTAHIVPWGSALADRCVLVELGGFDEAIDQSEDWDLQMRVAAEHDFVGTNDVVQRIRQHERGPVRHADWVGYLRECQEVERRGLRLVGRRGRRYLRRRASLLQLRGGDTHQSLQHAQRAVDRGDRTEALRFAATAIRRSPLHAVKSIRTVGAVARGLARRSV